MAAAAAAPATASATPTITAISATAAAAAAVSRHLAQSSVDLLLSFLQDRHEITSLFRIWRCSSV